MKNKMTIAYWHKDGLEIYRITDEKPVKHASGNLDELAPIKSGFGEKVLIVARELLFHVRKKYPPAQEEKLLKAVGLEVGEMFPLAKPAFHCRLFQSYDTYSVVDVWAWESDLYSRIREIFPFNHVIPEDVAFSSEVPEIRVFQYRELTSVLAHADGRFLAGASYPGPAFNQEEFERFLRSLEQQGVNIRKIRIYGLLPPALKADAKISMEEVKNYPPCLDEMTALELGRFKVRGDYYGFLEKKDIIFRVVLYLVLGYALMQFLTLKNYDRTADEIRQKIAVMDKEAASLDTGHMGEDYSNAIQAVNDKLKAGCSPVNVMNALARRLPDGSFVSRLVMNENNVEMTVSSKDPLSTVKALGYAEGVKKISLKGAPFKDRGSDLYNFVIVMEFVR